MRKGAIFCIMILLFCTYCGCGSAGERDSAEGSGSGPLRIVASVYPIYDWVKNILGEDHEGVELTLLLDSGVDLHSYQPTAKDIRTISDCDVFLYVGGESDAWVRDVLSQAGDPEMAVICLMDLLGDRAWEEEEIEGMQEARGEEEEESSGFDEHVWLSLKNAAIFCDAITDELARLDAEHEAVYRQNAAAYEEKLAELDAAYQETVDKAPIKTLLFGDRFPFRYLTEDYALEYYAAFSGCSAETEASVGTIIFLTKKADELGLSCVMALERSDHRLAETIAQNTGAKDLKILSLDSMQGITAEDVKAGATYLSIMEKNLEVLKKALQ